MQYTIKLFPEITIKSRPVRARFTSQLCHNLIRLLKPVDPGFAIEKSWDRLQVKSPATDAQVQARIKALLGQTPGISHFLEVADYPLVSLDDMAIKTRELFAEKLRHKTFAVRCKRNGEHAFTSIDVERQVGACLYQHCETAGVDLTEPEVLVRIEVVQDRFFVVLDRHEGLGGFPLGTQDAVLSLISGGFDSTVSSFLSMKRGLLTHFCFFNLGGRAHEAGVKEVALYLWMKYGASHPVTFVTVPFEEVLREILERVDNSQMGVVLKRMMLRAATKIAGRLEIQALVTGESVAQVSSQTLPNLAVIDTATDMLVLRPLAMMDKTDIIRMSRNIGTEPFAAVMPEYCGVISVKPTTRARAERIASEESHFDMAILEAAIANAQLVRIDHLVVSGGASEAVEIVTSVQAGEQVIDIRHPDEEEKNPLRLPAVDIHKIPFYSLHVQFKTLDRDKTWLLYCEKGVMSRLHAQYLKDEGHTNIKVYRP